MKLFFFFIFLLLSLFIIHSCKEDNPITPETIDLAPPTNVQLELEQGGIIKIQWQSQSKGHTGFRIERKRGINDNFSNIISTTGNIDLVRDSTANYADSLYYYRIAAYKGDQIGNYSEETSINLAFPAPSNLLITQANDFEISLSWADNSIIEVGFQIERKEGTGLFLIIDSVASGVTTYTDTQKLSGETSYFYRIKAFAKSFLSAQSNQVNVVTDFKAPTNLVSVFDSEELIILTWQDNSVTEDNFIIEMSEAEGIYNQIDTVPQNTTIFQYARIFIVNQNYSFRVLANSARRYSKYSNIPIIKLDFLNPVLSINAITESYIHMTWVDNTSFEKNFELQKRVGTTGIFSTVSASIPENATSYTDTFSVKTNTFYFYRLKAISPKGNVSAYTIDSTHLVFEAPSNLQLLNNTDDTFVLQWRDNSNYELGFMIEQINMSLNNKRDSILVPANTTEYNFTSLDKAFQYQFRIRAYTSKNFSEYSNALKIGHVLADLSFQWKMNDSIEYNSADLTTNSQNILVGGTNGTVRIIDQNGNFLRSLVSDVPSAIRCLGISPDNQKAAIGYDDGFLRIWSIRDGQILNSINTNSSILGLDWNSTSSNIATAHANQSVYIRNSITGTVIKTLTGHSDEVNTVKYFKDTLLVSGGSDRNVIVWLTASGSQVTKIQNAHSIKINSVDFLSTDRTVILSSGNDGLIKFWKTTDGSSISAIGAPFTSIAIGADLKSIITAGSDNLIKIWRYPDGILVRSNSAHTDVINAIAIDSNNKFLICTSKDKSYSLWSLLTKWVEIK